MLITKIFYECGGVQLASTSVLSWFHHNALNSIGMHVSRLCLKCGKSTGI